LVERGAIITAMKGLYEQKSVDIGNRLKRNSQLGKTFFFLRVNRLSFSQQASSFLLSSFALKNTLSEPTQVP
jgi:hypothetical protein